MNTHGSSSRDKNDESMQIGIFGVARDGYTPGEPGAETK